MHRLKPALVVVFTLAIAFAGGELWMRRRLAPSFSSTQVTAKTPGAGFGPLLPGRSFPYRLERIRRDDTTLAIGGAAGERHFSLAKTPGTPRVIALGDSLTEVWNVPGFENWVHVLEAELTKKLGRAEALPIGVGGYNTAHEVSFLREELGDLGGDVLILQMCSNDAEVVRLRPRAASELVVDVPGCKTPAEIRFGRLPEAPPEQRWPDYDVVGFDCRERTFDRAPLGSRLWWAIDRHLSAADDADRYGTRIVAADSAQRDALVALKQHAATRNMALLAVVFPRFYRGAQVEAEYMRALASSVDVPVLDLAEGMMRHAPLETLANAPSDSLHPSQAGHRLAAELLLERMTADGTLARLERAR